MGRGRGRNKVNATGRNHTSRFVRLDYRVLTSNAYRSLSTNARALLIELAMLYNGENNGSLYLSVRDGAARMGVADVTAASRAFDELADLGFIELTQESYFSVKAAFASRARCWRLAWAHGPARKAASWAFEECEPAPGTRAHKRMDSGLRALKTYRKARDRGQFPVVDSGTMNPFRPGGPVEAVAKSSTLTDPNDGFPPNSIVGVSPTHIAIPWGSGAAGGGAGWWQPAGAPVLAQLAIMAALASAHSTKLDLQQVAA